MITISKNTLAATVVALALGVTVATVSTPASARGGMFGLLNNFGSVLSNSSDNSSGNGLYDAAGTPARGTKCRMEKQKLYDDDDNVVGSRVVQVCPVAQQ